MVYFHSFQEVLDTGVIPNIEIQAPHDKICFKADTLLANMLAETLFSTKNSKYAMISCRDTKWIFMSLHMQKPMKFLNNSS